MYRTFIRPILFCMKPERAQRAFLALARCSSYFPGRPIVRLTHRYTAPELQRELFGINFPNPVGLAAGFDVDGESLGPLNDFGFGFIEIGSLSPHAQAPTLKQRAYRLNHDGAMLIRPGLKHKGIRNAIANIKKYSRPGLVVSANIAPNTSSHKDEEVIKDYVVAFSLLYDFVDMFTVNISCPNEDGILPIQEKNDLADIIDPLLELRLCYDTYKPILVKVSPDIPYEQLDEMLDYCQLAGVDGVVAGSYTKDRSQLSSKRSQKLEKITPAFVAGAPLYERNLKLVKHIAEYTKGRFPIIGCGGISSPEQAAEMLSSGASLIQIGTAISYKGPRLVKKTLKYLVNGQNH